MEIKRYGDFNPTGKSEKKHQIILVNTSRGIYEYLQTLKYRYNGKFKRIPNYIITRSGDVLQLIDNLEYSEYFGDTSMDQNSIIISFENLGWIQREPLTDYYVNWIGDIYKGEVYEKKWRDYYFWQPYTSKQVDSCAELCNILFKDLSIKNNIIGHNTKINYNPKYEGVLTFSNIEKERTDVSPAFNFEELIKKIENE
jgi:N-acetyl-anhydromuramyl-L-alanine amidase AmpD